MNVRCEWCRILDGDAESDFIKKIQPILREVERTAQPVLRYLPAKAPQHKQNSVLCVPLINAGKQVGLIYTELGGCFGRFSNQDLDLLKVLANQAAVAIENAAWAHTLEAKVEQRTIELQESKQVTEQRAAELAVINSVQAGLATKLDIQTIYELVGAKISGIFESDTMFIAIFDPATETDRIVYGIDDGKRFGQRSTAGNIGQQHECGA